MSETVPRKPATSGRRKWIIATALALAVLIVLVLLPVAVQYGLRNWLLENGGDQVQVTDVDLNLFTGTLQLEGVSVDVDEHNTLNAKLVNLDFAWLPLLKKHFTIEVLEISGINIKIEQGGNGQLHVGGIAIPASEDAGMREEEEGGGQKEKAAGWGIGIDALTFSDIGIQYSMPELQIDSRIKRLTLHDLTAWAPEEGARISLQASINGAPLEYEGSIAPFAENMRIEGHVNLQGLPLANFRQIAHVAEELGGKLSLETDLSLAQSGTEMSIQLQTGKLQLDELLFASPQIRLRQQSLRWAGNLELNQTNAGPQAMVNIHAVGEITGEQLNTAIEQQKLDISQQDLQLAVDFKFDSGKTDTDPVITALLDKVLINELHARVDGYPLAGVGRLTLDKLKFQDPLSLGIEKILLDELYVAKDMPGEKPGKNETAAVVPTALFSNHKLTIERLALSDGQQLDIDDIRLNGMNIHLTRAADGGTNIDVLTSTIERMAATETTQTEETEKESNSTEQAADTPAIFRIGNFQISENSLIVIDDAAVTPNTRIDIGIDDLEVTNINNTSAEEITRIKGNGKFGRFGSYKLSGELQPFAEKASGKILATIKGIDLPRLSPYTTDELGFSLRSGTLSSDIDVAIKQDQLSGETQLTIQQLELIPVEKKGQQGGMNALSLNTSLNMLRDSNNTITMKIPLSGDINAPDFSVQDAINQALMSGATNGAMTYFMYALQPYGTMLAVAKIAGEQITKLRLDPVRFGAGSSEVDETGKDYLNKVAKILATRPKVAIKVCGIAVDSDAAALVAISEKSDKKNQPGDEKIKKQPGDEKIKKQLKQLARQRAIAVREYLISQSSESGAQLVSCRPEAETGKPDAMPRAELLI